MDTPNVSRDGLLQPSSDNTIKGREFTATEKVSHGFDYQVQWLMLVALQSRKHVGENFKFRTEDKGAGKFDDIVWFLKNDESVRCNLMQTKHYYKDSAKCITRNDLFTQNEKTSNFALQKYFVSYRDVIKKNPQYSVIDSLILATNIDLNDELKQQFVQMDNGESEKILSIFSLGIWKVDIDKTLYKEIQQMLEYTYDLIKIAKMLGDCVHNNQEFKLDGHLQPYQHTIFNNIMNQENGFCENFIKGENLSEEFQNLRKAFYREAFEKKRSLVLADNHELIDPEKFAKELALIIIKSKEKIVKIQRRGIIEENIDKLSGYVIIEENGSFVFNSNFWSDEDDKLPHTSFKSFKQALEKEFHSHLSVTDLHNYKLDILGKNPRTGKKFETLKYHLLGDKLFWDYVKRYRNLSNDSSNLTPAENIKKLPADSFTSIDRDITEFLGKLLFALKYSKENLESVITTELTSELGYIEDDHYVSKFKTELRSSLDITKIEMPLSNSEQVKKFIDETAQMIHRLSFSNNTSQYRNMIKDAKIQFKQEAIDTMEIQKFLNDSSKQILNIITSQHVLSSIKIHQFFMNTPKFEKIDSFLFITSKDLNAQNQVTEIFKSRVIDLLMIQCQYLQKDRWQDLWINLQNIIDINSHKKIIMIGQKQEISVFQSHSDTIQVVVENVDKGLTDLTDTSQQHILGSNCIIFQGKQVQLSSLPDRRDIYNATTLSQLINICVGINKENICVGIKKPDLSDLQSIYYSPCREIGEKQLRDGIHNNPKDIFVFSGITKEEICKLIPETNKKQTEETNRGKHFPGSIQYKYFILENENTRKMFKEICSDSIHKNKNEINAIHLIERENKSLIWKQSFNISIYISCKLGCRIIDKYALNKYVKDSSIFNDIFIIIGNTGVTEMNISKLEKILADAKTNENNAPGKKYILTIENSDDQETYFNNICSNNALQGFNIHLLQEKSEKLLWRRTKGRLIHLHDLVDARVSYPINENEFGKIVNSEKIIVLAGEPGVGKSTSLIHMLQSFAENEWVIKIDLINFQDDLENYSFTNDLDSILMLILNKNSAQSSQHFERNMLKNRITHAGYISIIFDGFDEITSTNQEKVIHLLLSLKNTKSKLIITTRSNVKDKLENALGVFSYLCLPFSVENQKTFLQTFWEASLKFSNTCHINHDLLSTHVNNFLQKIYSLSLGKSKNLLRTPLLTKMVAEIYHPTFEQIRTSKYAFYMDENLTKVIMYEKIVQKNYEKYLNEKTAVIKNFAYVRKKVIEGCDMDHQHLALRTLYSNSKQAKNLVSILKLTSPEDLEELKLVGLIQSSSSSGQFYFIHQTLAEYFAACFFFNTLKQERSDLEYKLIQSFLLTEIFKNKNKGIYDFLENMIQKENNNLQSKWKSLKSSNLLQGGGSIQLFSITESDSSRTRQTTDDTSLDEMQIKVESHINWQNESQYYYYNDDLDLVDIRDLFQYFKYETDLETLRNTFNFFIKIFNKSKLFKLNNFLKYNMPSALIHYLTEYRNQNHEIRTIITEYCTKIIPEYYNDFEIHINKADLVCILARTSEYTNKKEDFEWLNSMYKSKEKDIVWLEREGIGINTSFSILTQEISKIYISQIKDNNNRSTGWGSIYANCIFKDFLIPALDLLKINRIHNFDELAIIDMLTCFIDFFIEKRMRICISSEQLHTAINLIEKVLDKQSANIPLIHYIPILANCSEFIITLTKAGIIIIDTDHQLLFLDPVSEFQCILSNWKEQITHIIKRRLETTKNKLTTKEAAWEEMFPTNILKRRISENDDTHQDIKRREDKKKKKSR